jgi:DHA1 family tetracycline resistance protein-like MFS transporter
MKSHKHKRHAAVIFVFITVTLDVLALGIMIPVFPRLIQGFEGGDTAKAALSIGVISTIFAVMQFFCSPIIGSLSDKFGRRPLILLSNFGTSMDYILMALAPDLTWLYVGRVISGIMASSIPTAGAYIADVTPPKKRAAGFGLLGAAFGIGFVLGPALGGLLGHYSLRLPFWFAAGLSLLNWLYGYFVLPESLPPRNRSDFSWKKSNPLGSLQLLRSHHELFGLSMVNFLGFLAHMVLQTVFVLYAGYRYQWDERVVGLCLMLVGITSGAVQGGLVGPVVKKIKERWTLLVGLLFGTLGFTVFGWAPTGLWFMAGVPLLALWGMNGPAIQGLMTRHVSHREQGRLQGANSCIQSIAEIIGPGLFTSIFALFIGDNRPLLLPGAPFFLSALLVVAAALVAWKVTQPGRKK